MILATVFFLLALVVPWVVAVALQMTAILESVPVVPLAVWSGAVLMVFLLFVYLWRRKSKEATPESSEKSSPKGPDHDMMKQRIRAVKQRLRGSRLGVGHSSGLYSRPWIAVIGASQSGKTTLIGRSGVPFSASLNHPGGGQRAPRVTGSTIGWDFWLSEEALFIDTAGALLSHDQGQGTGWRSFVDLLKQHRAKRPVDGLAFAITAESLLLSGEPRSLGGELRILLDQAYAAWGLRPPVQIVITKLDRLVGFEETFGSLTDEDASRALEVDLRGCEATGEAGVRLARLKRSVSRFGLSRLSRIAEGQGGSSAAEKAARFQEHFDQLIGGAQEFLAEFSLADELSARPNVVGFSFGSAALDGTEIDLLPNDCDASVMGEVGDERSQLRSGARLPGRRRAYFLKEAFEMMVKAAVSPLLPTRARARKQKLVASLLVGSVVLAALGLACFSSLAWASNRKLVSDTERVLKEDAGGEASLTELAAQFHTLTHYLHEGPPARLRFGFYQGERLRSSVRAHLVDVARRELVDSLVLEVGAELHSFARESQGTPVNDAPYDAAFETLKSYALLTSPTLPGEPKLTAETRDALAAFLEARLDARCAGQNSIENSNLPCGRAVPSVLTAYLRGIGESPSSRTPAEAGLIEALTLVLRRRSESERVLSSIAIAHEDPALDIRLESLVGDSPSLEQHTREVVSSIYTRRAWEHTMHGVLSGRPEPLREDAWVLGETSQSGGALLTALRSLYFTRYVSAWRGFLDSLASRRPRGEADALDLTRELTRGSPTPLQAVFYAVADNSELGPVVPASLQRFLERTQSPDSSGTGVSSGGAAADVLLRAQAEAYLGRWPRALNPRDPLEASPGFVARELAPFVQFAGERAMVDGSGAAPTPSIATYEEQIRFLRDALSAHLLDPARAPELAERLRQTKTTVRGLIEQQPIGSRPNFEALLWPPVEAASAYSRQAMSGATGRAFCADVARSHRETLHGTYPFYPRGEDLSLGDFDAFYGPGGILWSFVAESLAGDVVAEGVRYRFVNSGRGRAPYRTSLLAFLNRSRDVTRTFYPPGSGTVRVEFDARIRPNPEVAHAELVVDGERIAYQNGPSEWKRLRWPGPEGSARGASLSVRGRAGLSEMVQRTGEWGLFRLFEAGTVERTDARRFTVRLPLSRAGLFMEIDVRTARGPSPFFLSGGTRGRAGGFLSVVRAGAGAPEPIFGRGQRCPE